METNRNILYFIRKRALLAQGEVGHHLVPVEKRHDPKVRSVWKYCAAVYKALAKLHGDSPWTLRDIALVAFGFEDIDKLPPIRKRTVLARQQERFRKHPLPDVSEAEEGGH